MKNEITKLVQEHLEFLGYTVEDSSDANAGPDRLNAKHARKSNIVVIVDDEAMIHLQANYGAYPFGIVDKMIKAANSVNLETLVTKWSINEKMSTDGLAISIEACQFGYTKKSFMAMLDGYNYDVREYMQKFEEFSTVKAPVPAKKKNSKS